MKKNISITVTTSLLGLFQVATADVTSGLAAYWSFDDCTAQDNSGNGNNGTKVGGVKCVVGKRGKAMQFNGSNSYIKVPSSTSLNPVNQWTMSFWMKIQGITNEWSPLLHKGGQITTDFSNREYSTWLSSNPSLYLSSAGDDLGEYTLMSPTVSLTGWIHYVGIIDRVNNFMSIYLNGKKVAETTDSYSSFNNNTYDLRIGWTEEKNPGFSPFKGILDEIRLYNRALTAADITELYNIELVGTNKGLQQFDVICTNTTTGQTVTIPSLTAATTWSCNKAGLKTSPNQQIHIEIDGNTYP